MDRYHLNFLLIDPCPLAGTQFVEYAGRLEQTAVQLFSVEGLSAEGFTPAPNAVVYAWQVGEEAANGAALARLRQYFGSVPLVVSTKPEGLTAVAQLKHIHSYILHPYVGDDVERLVEQIHQREVSKRANDLHPLLAEMVSNPDEPITLQTVVDLLVDRFHYAAVVCHVMTESGYLICCNHAGIATHEALLSLQKFSISEGVVGKAAQTGEIQAIDDLTHVTYQFTEMVACENVTSIISIPLKLRQDVLGVISCFTRHLNHFTSSETDFLIEVANLSVLELNNARQRLQWQKEDKAVRELISVHNLQDAIYRVVDNALSIAEASGASACFYSSDQGHFLGNYQKSKGIRGGIIDWSGRNAEWTQLQQIILTEGVFSVSSIPAWSQFPGIREALHKHRIESFIGLRLRGDELNVGVLFLFYHWPHPYTKLGREHMDKHTVNIYAGMAATVIERMYHQERQAKELGLIRRWAEVTGTGLPMQGVENTFWVNLLERILMVTGGERGAVCLQTEPNEWQIYAKGMPEQYVQSQIQSDDLSLERMAMKSKKPLVSCDLQVVTSKGQQHTLCDKQGTVYKLQASPNILIPRSRLVAPVQQDQRCTGLIILESKQPNTFNRYDADFLHNFTQHIGIALGYDTVMRGLGQSSQNFPVVQLIRSDLERMLDELRVIIDCDIATLFRYSPYWEMFQQPISSGKLLYPNKAFGFNTEALQKVLLRSSFGKFVTDLNLIRQAFPLFVDREKIQSACAIGLHNECNEPIGVLVLHCRSKGEPSRVAHTYIRQFMSKMESLINQAYLFPKIVEILRQSFKFDAVRLHLYKQKEDKWSLPVTAGTIYRVLKWNLQDTGGVIKYAMSVLNGGGKPYRFVNNAQNDSALTKGGFIDRENIRSGGYVILEVRDEVVGILFVNWRDAHTWTEAEKNALLIFAKQAAMGIYNRRLVAQLKEEGVSSNWMQSTVGAIIKAGLNQQAALDAILEQALVITQAHFGVIRLLDEKDPNWVNTVAVTGIKGDEKAWFAEHGRVPLEGKGISLLALRENRRQFVPDVHVRPYVKHYVDAADGGTRSEIAVVLRHMLTGDRIGVIDVEHSEVGGFSQQALKQLITFAEVASIVLYNIGKDADLSKTKEEMAQIESFAWLGMFGSNWWHTACQKSAAIRACLEMLKDCVVTNNEALQHVSDIEELVDKIDAIPEEGWLPHDLAVEPEPLLIDKQIKTAVSECCLPYPHVRIQWDLQSPDTLVAVYEKLLREAIKNLVANAIRAMHREGQLTIQTRVKDKSVYISLQDTGTGIPDYILPYLFKRRVLKEDRPHGAGIGAYMAGFIFRRHRGRISVTKSDGSGTHLEIVLPTV